MATVKQHYEEVLSDVYSWLYGGFEDGIQNNLDFFKAHKVAPQGSGIALDLGAGCGFQAIALAKSGYKVTAIDLDAKLLGELNENAEGLEITTVQGDLIDFDQNLENHPELIICMTDTILHLESKEKVIALFKKTFSALEKGGKFILTFRNLIYELKDNDRILPVRSDENIIFTCFLEYEAETVKVHDIVYRKSGKAWTLSKSFYRKLRLSETWISEQLSQVGFSKIASSTDKGVITLIAQR